MGSGTARRVVFGIGRLGKFCCVELGPGSARTGKVRRGRCGVFQFGKLRHGMFRQARNGMLSFVM